MLSISILGPAEVRREGALTPLPAGKSTEVLIRLALESTLTVSADRIIEDLWGTEASATARNTLQTKVSRLRRALGDAALVSGGRTGYCLEVDPRDVDALEVLRVADAAEGLLQSGDLSAAIEASTRGLSMFHGDVVLADAGDGDWLIPFRTRLEEIRLGLVEGQLAARVELGAARELIGELEGLVAIHPLRERLWELLVTALYRAGRQADALAAYQRVRVQLSEDLGLDPGVRLQQLEQQILVQDASLEPPPPSGADERPVGNLPSVSSELVGRGTEVAELCVLVGSNRLVEIVGPGGVGKTATAIAVGRALSTSSPTAYGGVWLARLETASTDDDVIDTVIAAVNVGGEAALFERLKGLTGLLILDNCEHVRDAAATLASRLLDASPGLRVLCTSQIPLDVDGEVVFELAPLELSDAVELFTRRSAAGRLSPTSTGTDQAVADLCRSLDGLPLVIELAAARTKTLSVEEISRRLDDRFSVLSDPTSRRPERRRSLRSTIRWSYDLLFPDDQLGLWALATFSGGAPLPAVESVLEALDIPATAAIDVVGRLASRSLVIVDEDAQVPTGAGPDGAALHSVRYRLLDSIRAFARDELAEAGWSDRAGSAHAQWFAGHARTSTAGVRSRRQADYLSFARTERANIDAALAWSGAHDPALALELVNGFGWAWVVLGDSRGAERILAALTAVGPSAQAGDRITALLLAAWIEASTDRLALARDHVATATALADELQDADLQARCSYYLAYVVSHHGEFRRALELTDGSHALYDGLDRPWDQAANGLFAARAAISAGDEVRSEAAAADVQHWLALVDDPWLQVRGDAMLGELARLQHRFDDAVLHLGRAAEASGRLGFAQTEAYQLMNLGRAQCQAGDYERGAATLEVAVDKAEGVGDVRLAALARVHLGRVRRALGRLTQARVALDVATSWHQAAGGGEQAALGECLLAAMDAADGVPGSRERLEAAVAEARDRDDAPVEVLALDALALLAAAAGDVEQSRDLVAAADLRMAAASHFITELDRADRRAVSRLVADGSGSPAGSAAGTPAARP